MEIGQVHLHSVGLFDVVETYVGSSDGLVVGLDDGLMVVGSDVGRLVGLLVVGLAVGTLVTIFAVGLIVEIVGLAVGTRDGPGVGTLVGLAVDGF